MIKKNFVSLFLVVVVIGTFLVGNKIKKRKNYKLFKKNLFFFSFLLSFKKTKKKQQKNEK